MSEDKEIQHSQQPPLMEIFAARLKAARLNKGWSQLQLAIAIELDTAGEAAIAAWERGENSGGLNPLEYLERLSTRLDYSPPWFLGYSKHSEKDN